MFSFRRSGYTLIELIAVVAIMMVVAAAAVSNLSLAVERQRLKAVATTFIADVGNIRENAILDQKNLRIYFPITGDMAGREYYLEYAQKDPIHLVHYTPADAENGHSFVLRKVATMSTYSFVNSTLPSSVITVNSVQYAYVTIYCGADTHFRGQLSTTIPPEINFTSISGACTIKVIMTLAGRASLLTN